MNFFRRYPILAVAWAVLCLAGTLPGRAEEGWRTWTSAAGSAIKAKLVSNDFVRVTLEKEDGQRLVVKLSQLSDADQEFLAGMEPAEAPKGELTLEAIPAEPGTVSRRIECLKGVNCSYFLYLPKDFHTGRSWPVCFVMDPGGGSAGTLGRYLPAAEHLGMILAVSVESKNGFPDSSVAMMAMVEDVYDRMPVIGEIAIASGMSGGSRMAYLMAETEENVAGVLACGSGAGVYPPGGSFRQAKLRRGTVVCSLIGSNDFNRREAVKAHGGLGKDARFIWFPGNHDWAGEEVIVDGMADVYGKILRKSKARELDPLRVAFAKNQLAWAKRQQESQPWLTHRWAAFLADFSGDAVVQREAADLEKALERDETVAQALKAEKAIADFADKHFADGDTKSDNSPDSSREKEAAKAAGEFQGIPHAVLLERMGGPSPPP